MSDDELSVESLLHLAEAALDDGEPETAIELCGQILVDHPHEVAAMLLQAEALREVREPALAEPLYRHALEVDPTNAQAWTGLGASLFDQGSFDEAGDAHGRAIRLDDTLPDAWYGRALVRERRGDHAGARRDYLRAWKLSQGFPPPRSLSDGDLRALLLEAAASAGDDVRAWVEAAPMIVLDHPDPETCEAYEPPASPSELLGHLTLHPTGDGDGGATGWTAFPPSVLLFRRNLERWPDAREQLVEALRDTVLAHVSAWLQAPTVDA